MIGFIRRKMTLFHENLVRDFAQILKEENGPLKERLEFLEEQFCLENNSLKERLESMEEQLRLAQRQERRRQLLLDFLKESSSAVQSTLDRMELNSPSLESLLVFAESFLLAHIASPESPDKHILKNKFFGLLQIYGITPILDLHVPFNPEIHQACGAVQLEDLPDGLVVQIVRPGFIKNEALFRPALVMVNQNQDYILFPDEGEEKICSTLL
jgi:molecular chaperone GrpE